jgi:hypothetical protein
LIIFFFVNPSFAQANDGIQKGNDPKTKRSLELEIRLVNRNTRIENWKKNFLYVDIRELAFFDRVNRELLNRESKFGRKNASAARTESRITNHAPEVCSESFGANFW